MPLDPRLPLLAGQGVTPVRDPLQTMGAVYQLRGQQMEIQEAQRQEQERGSLVRAFQGAVRTDPTTGQTSIDMPTAFSGAYRAGVNPLTVLKAETEYGKSQAESRKSVLEAHKMRLEGLQKQTEYVSGLANGVLMAIDQGADPQTTYQRAVQQARQVLGPEMIQGLPPTFDRGVVTQFAMSGLKSSEALTAQQKVVDQQLREYELAETQKRTQLEARRAGLEERRVGVQEQQERRAAGQAAQQVPEYVKGEGLLNAAIHPYMQERGLTGTPPPDILRQGRKDLVEGKVAVAGAQGYEAAVSKPLEGPALQRVNMLMQGEDVVQALQTEFTPEERARYVGLGGLRMTAQQVQQLLADAGQGKADPKFARFAALIALGKQEAFGTAGQALSGHERDVVFGYIPTGKEWSAQEFEEKLRLSRERLPTLIDRELTLATTPRSELREKRRRGELPSMAPGSPPSPAGGGSPYGHLPATQLTPAQRREELEWLRKQRPTP